LYFRQPVPFAKASMTVDHLSGGRVELALGVGDPSAGAKASGVDWPAGERVARFGEFVELVGLLLRQEVTTYHGQFYRCQDAEMVPRSRCAAGWVRTAGSSGKLMTGASGVPGVFQRGARRAEARAHSLL
jgi:alkanesulfonate monooxygenase SsuD/methylene tetrahydromethanopterin reductase-like flavin-dependent oxidoreductase (luciferase family)